MHTLSASKTYVHCWVHDERALAFGLSSFRIGIGVNAQGSGGKRGGGLLAAGL